MRAVACLALSGCAWITVPSVNATMKSPPQELSRELGSCSQSSPAVKADVVGAVLSTMIGAILVDDAQPHQSCFIGCHQTEYDSQEEGKGYIFLGVAVAYVVSAFVGHSRVSECDALHAQYDAEVARNPPQPPPGYYAPPPYGPPMQPPPQPPMQPQPPMPPPPPPAPPAR